MEIGSDHKVYRGVANVGVKPTFHDPSVAQVVIEVNIFDFDDDIYGERVTVFWRQNTVTLSPYISSSKSKMLTSITTCATDGS